MVIFPVSDPVYVNGFVIPHTSSRRAATGCAGVAAGGSTLSVPRPRTAARPDGTCPALLRKEGCRAQSGARSLGSITSPNRRPCSETGTWLPPVSSGSRPGPPTSRPSNGNPAERGFGNGVLAGRAGAFDSTTPHRAAMSLRRPGGGRLPLKAAVPSRWRASAGRIRRSSPWPYRPSCMPRNFPRRGTASWTGSLPASRCSATRPSKSASWPITCRGRASRSTTSTSRRPRSGERSRSGGISRSRSAVCRRARGD